MLLPSLLAGFAAIALVLIKILIYNNYSMNPIYSVKSSYSYISNKAGKRRYKN